MRKIEIIPMSRLIDLKRKRVFIENDFSYVWDEDEKKEIETDIGMTIEKAFPIFIGEATTRAIEVLRAIKENDDIFVDTSYVGDSAELLNAMLAACVKAKISGKRIFNFRSSKSLQMDGIETELFWEIAKNNLFYYRHDYYPNKSFVLSGACK